MLNNIKTTSHTSKVKTFNTTQKITVSTTINKPPLVIQVKTYKHHTQYIPNESTNTYPRKTKQYYKPQTFNHKTTQAKVSKTTTTKTRIIKTVNY